jgi:hypothetical protein
MVISPYTKKRFFQFSINDLGCQEKEAPKTTLLSCCALLLQELLH